MEGVSKPFRTETMTKENECMGNLDGRADGLGAYCQMAVWDRIDRS